MSAIKIRRKAAVNERVFDALAKEIIGVCGAHLGKPEALAAILKALRTETLSAISDEAEFPGKRGLELGTLLTLYAGAAVSGSPTVEASDEELEIWVGLVCSLVNLEGMRRKRILEYTVLNPDPFHSGGVDKPVVETKFNVDHPLWQILHRLPPEHRESAIRAGGGEATLRYAAQFLSEEDMDQIALKCGEFQANLPN
jgi:hypothetical protein